MRLEIGNFYVKDIVFGNELSYEDGILTIEKEAALNYIRQDERITEAELYIAKPGDQIRMCPVKEAIEPRVRPDGRSAFPGYTGDMTRAGEGVTYALSRKTLGRISGWNHRYERRRSEIYTFWSIDEYCTCCRYE